MENKQKLRDTEWMYYTLMDYCKENNLKNALVALPFAREVYDSIKPRKDGEPYLIHPLSITLKGIALGITDDISISTELLHDVKEEKPDCDLDNLNVADLIKQYTYTLTYVPIDGLSKIESQKIYYHNILKALVTTRTKGLDRADNVSTMSWTFEKDKIGKYDEETYRFYPEVLCKWAEMASTIIEQIQVWTIYRSIFTCVFSNERFLEQEIDEEVKRNLLKIRTLYEERRI